MLSILEQERGLRDLADYRSLLAIAARSAELKDVVEATKIEVAGWARSVAGGRPKQLEQPRANRAVKVDTKTRLLRHIAH